LIHVYITSFICHLLEAGMLLNTAATFSKLWLLPSSAVDWTTATARCMECRKRI